MSQKEVSVILKTTFVLTVWDGFQEGIRDGQKVNNVVCRTESILFVRKVEKEIQIED